MFFLVATAVLMLDSPREGQVFPRDTSLRGSIVVAGRVEGEGGDSVQFRAGADGPWQSAKLAGGSFRAEMRADVGGAYRVEVRLLGEKAIGVERVRVGEDGEFPARVTRAYHVVRRGLPNAYARLKQGPAARVAFMGGSITEGGAWRDLVCADLKRRFPQTSIECVNAGISSTGSTPGAFRLLRDVFGAGPVDLLFEEAAVNDDSNGFPPREQVRGMEGIVRHALLVNPKLDIVLLHFVDPKKMEQYRQGRTPEVIASHERVAAHYGLPSIDLAREVTDRIDAREFTWEKDFVNLHPSPFGHRLYAASVGRLLDEALGGLPPPIDERSYFRGRLEDVSKVERGEGWRIDPDWAPPVGQVTRKGFVHVPMLVSETPGAACRYAFEGTAVGIFVAAGLDAGAVEYSIDGGPFRRQDLFTQWSPQLHIPWAYVLDADLAPGAHVLTLRVAAESNSQSRGHAVRIVHLLAN